MSAQAQHAPLPPSGAPQWGFCSGSVMANMNAPDIEHPRTRAGTASHWVAGECLQRWASTEGGACFCMDWHGAEAPNGVILDDEMIEGAQIFVNIALQIAQEHGALQGMLVEHRVKMPMVHAQNWGTLDLCIPLLNKEADGRVMSGVIYMIDYKFGHRECKAFGNLQLIDYLVGICHELRVYGAAEEHVEVIFQIVQPFCYHSEGHVDEWRTTVAELRGYVAQLTAKAQEVFSNPTFSSGSHCRDCAAIGRCATARKSHYSLIEYTNDPCVIDTMTGADLAVERGLLKQGTSTLKARLDAIDEDLKHRIGKGESDSGLALESSTGNLAWTVPPSQAVAFASGFGVDAAKPSVLTPTQTIEAAPAKMKPILKAALKAVTKRPTTGLKLIKAGDTKTARAFAKK